MKYRLLGNSGLRVSPLCLGTMTFGEDWGWGSSQETSKAIFDAFLEAGGNFIDTANVYTEGSSEIILSDLIQADRDHIVLATKYTLSNTTHNPNKSGNHRKNLIQSVEKSLQRLKTDYIDVLYVHAWDFTTPVKEVMRSLDDLVRQGKVFYIGISDTPAWIVSMANTWANEHALTPFIVNQIEYNLTERAPERDLLPMSKHLNLGVVAWSPLATGILTGKYLNEDISGTRNEAKTSYRFNDRNERIVREVVKIAVELSISPARLALAWLLHKGVMPIIGARKLHQLEDNLGAVDVVLTTEQMKRLDEVSNIELGFPHDFVLRPGAQKMIYGDMVNQIEGIKNDNLFK
ncbi:MAG: aldo/keto reductase [Bacteroidota bacterium]